jgi:hypothetical protein
MEYQGFVVEAFEREPGRWRAKISRSSRKPLITGRKKIWQFVTGADATTASDALLMALEAIDAGTFSSAVPAPEKFWRRRGRRSHAPQATNGLPALRRTRFKMAGRKPDRVNDRSDPTS